MGAGVSFYRRFVRSGLDHRYHPDPAEAESVLYLIASAEDAAIWFCSKNGQEGKNPSCFLLR